MANWHQALERRAYSELRLKLADPAARAEAARRWSSLSPLEKLTLFKLMDASAAMEFYESLAFEERYFLLGGFPLQAIAPVLEPLDAVQRRFFVQLPRDCWDQMFRGLLADVEGRKRSPVPIAKARKSTT